FNHYQRDYPPQKTILKYAQLAKYLNEVVHLPQELPLLKMNAVKNPPAMQPSFEWDAGNQGFTIHNATPGVSLRIRYNYFPLWSTDDGLLLRGSQEQMLLLPSKESIRVTYSQFHSWGY